MRSFLRHIIGRNTPQQFASVRIPVGKVVEKVFLQNRGQQVEITTRHNITCQTPMHIAALLSASEFDSLGGADCEVLVTRNGHKVSVTSVTLVRNVLVEARKGIYIFKTVDARCYHANEWFQNILLNRFKNPHNHTHLEKKIMAALYSYPRNINVVSFKNEDYYNIFPMDFQCALTETGHHIFGLRTTNITLEKILKEKKVVVSDPGEVDIKTIYFLGSHNSKVPPGISELPFTVSESELYKFPVPDFAASYKEIEVLDNYLLGSHMFFVGKVINQQQIAQKKSSLCHLHFFQYLKSDYKAEH